MWEKEAAAGGVATSFDLPDGRFINDGVQGGSPAYRNTAMLLKEHGLGTAPVKFTVSFGQGDACWGNTFESDVTRRLESDVRRFGAVLRWVSRFEPLFVFVPIHLLLKVLNFSAEFRNLMVRLLTLATVGTLAVSLATRHASQCLLVFTRTPGIGLVSLRVA